MGTQREVKPPRVVLDTNCVVSALLFEHGRLAWLRRAWQREAILPLADEGTLRELIRVLGYPRFRLVPAEQEALLAEYIPWVEIVTGTPNHDWTGLADTDDAPFLDLAPAGLLEILWDDFFQGPGVSEDFMRHRAQPPMQERPPL